MVGKEYCQCGFLNTRQYDSYDDTKMLQSRKSFTKEWHKNTRAPLNQL